MKVTVVVRLKEGVLDVQGEAVRHALEGLGLAKVGEARVGKVIELDIAARDAKEARRLATMACDRLLVNPTLEDYSLEVSRGG